MIELNYLTIVLGGWALLWFANVEGDEQTAKIDLALTFLGVILIFFGLIRATIDVLGI